MEEYIIKNNWSVLLLSNQYYVKNIESYILFYRKYVVWQNHAHVISFILSFLSSWQTPKNNCGGIGRE